MPFSNHTAAASAPLSSFAPHSRVASAVALVALAHAALLAIVVLAKQEAVSRPIESPVMTAQLLSPAPVAATPAALVSAAQPAPPVQRPSVKKHEMPRPARVIETPSSKPAPAASPAPAEPPSSQPSQTATTAAPAPAAQAPAAQAPAPSQRETLAISAPRNVPHVECNVVKPDYPALSRRRGESGTAGVRFVIGLTGAIENVELARSSGYTRLDDAAVAAMRASTCRPYIENGVAVRAAYTQPFAFALDD
ncbi:energy transducer TonB [Trinickia fusca]|uniref:Energy transducer TonB n=1 Tax=Trinickia fusca TaxID=2419777 RepID=A0A494XIJ8_9BURK|nr:energy transducer TonB [Trinickia fusca]RKP50565.1 energy transducer TonB [Trinickia fusca]